jgi:hypothetical protein
MSDNSNTQNKILLQAAVENVIDFHYQKADDFTKYKIVSSCMNQCVNTFSGNELLLTERNCLQKCFYNTLENYYINKLA